NDTCWPIQESELLNKSSGLCNVLRPGRYQDEESMPTSILERTRGRIGGYRRSLSGFFLQGRGDIRSEVRVIADDENGTTRRCQAPGGRCLGMTWGCRSEERQAVCLADDLRKGHGELHQSGARMPVQDDDPSHRGAANRGETVARKGRLCRPN